MKFRNHSITVAIITPEERPYRILSKVNGWYPNYGSSRYQLKDGDVVEWRYTCDLGNDVGGGYAVGG